MRIASMVIVLQGLTAWLVTPSNGSSSHRSQRKLEKLRAARQRSNYYEISGKGDLRDHQIVFPTKFHGESWTADENDSNNHSENDILTYRVNAFNKDFYIILSRNEEFLSFGLVIQHLYHNYTWLENKTSSPGGFFDGKIRGDTGSVASFSLCDKGMSGMFQTGGEAYYMEPDHQSRPSHLSFFRNHSLPHVIYRHQPSSKPSASPTNGSQCSSCDEPKDTKDDDMDIANSISHSNNTQQKSHRISSINVTDFTIDNKSNETKSRSRRSFSRDHFVEILVVADHSMYVHHGDDVLNYVLTLLAIASSVYRDASIGNSVNIVVVKVIILKSEKGGPKIIDSSAALTLREFCRWEHRRNDADDSSINHHDVAILITRENICRKAGECETLGLAELGNVCDPIGSCAIIEDNGMSAAYTIAHELGHIFNLPHDDDKKCSPYLRSGENNLHIMAPIIDYSTSPWTWSECSRHLLTEFLDSGQGRCLRDRPQRRKFWRIMKKILYVSAGATYGVDQQCELLYGAGSKYCPYMGPCKRLWCINKRGRNSGCMTQHMPWTEGSTCGYNKWCVRGVCMVKRPRLRPTRGGWGKWQSFGPCSRTCGGGVKHAVRMCNNPRPRRGGKYCVGRRAKYKSCNTQPCPPSHVTFREIQCSSFNGQYRINGLDPNVKWTPKYSLVPSDMCKLLCQASSNGAFYQFKAKVLDGTKCHPDTTNICVNGKCRTSGCDNRLRSTLKRDKCGVCGGDNSSCRTISGTYNRKPVFGYNTVTRIPSGATNIDIRQYGSSVMDDNYLAMMDARGHYLLNGNLTVSKFRRQIKLHGSKFTYSGSDTLVEQIRSSGIIHTNVTVLVLSVGRHVSPNIHYKYDVSINDNHVFSWNRNGPWTYCDKICQGKRKRKIICQRQHDGVIVSGKMCHQKRKPRPITEACNTECTIGYVVRWEAMYKGPCSVQCGVGIMRQDIVCVRRIAKEEHVLAEQYCANSGRKPPRTTTCEMRCAAWQYSPWSQCSQSCGTGIRQRAATCIDQTGQTVADEKCGSTAKKVAESCNTFVCPQWLASNWSQCSVRCGQGKQVRNLSCMQGSTEVAVSNCHSLQKPPTKRVCHPGPCPQWQYGKWGQCTLSCGRGIQTRAVRCRTHTGKYTHNRRCLAISLPIQQRTCNQQPCPANLPPPTLATALMPRSTIYWSTTTRIPDTYWKYTHWTRCSATCGMGVRRRLVMCMSRGNSRRSKQMCRHLRQPRKSEPCTMGPCGQWRTGAWGECHQSCGSAGVQTRRVACMLPTHEVTSDLRCDVNNRPHTERMCNRVECRQPSKFSVKNIVTNKADIPVRWRVGTWTLCSVTCGRGHQRRQVICHHQSFGACDESRRPEAVRQCEAGDCPYWYTGAWSQCEESKQGREVRCQTGGGKVDVRVVPQDRCNRHPRPHDTQSCTLTPPRWNRGRYSPVSYSRDLYNKLSPSHSGRDDNRRYSGDGRDDTDGTVSRTGRAGVNNLSRMGHINRQSGRGDNSRYRGNGRKDTDRAVSHDRRSNIDMSRNGRTHRQSGRSDNNQYSGNGRKDTDRDVSHSGRGDNSRYSGNGHNDETDGSIRRSGHSDRNFGRNGHNRQSGRGDNSRYSDNGHNDKRDGSISRSGHISRNFDRNGHNNRQSGRGANSQYMGNGHNDKRDGSITSSGHISRNFDRNGHNNRQSGRGDNSQYRGNGHNDKRDGSISRSGHISRNFDRNGHNIRQSGRGDNSQYSGSRRVYTNGNSGRSDINFSRIGHTNGQSGRGDNSGYIGNGRKDTDGSSGRSDINIRNGQTDRQRGRINSQSGRSNPRIIPTYNWHDSKTMGRERNNHFPSIVIQDNKRNNVPDVNRWNANRHTSGRRNVDDHPSNRQNPNYRMVNFYYNHRQISKRLIKTTDAPVGSSHHPKRRPDNRDGSIYRYENRRFAGNLKRDMSHIIEEDRKGEIVIKGNNRRAIVNRYEKGRDDNIRIINRHVNTHIRIRNRKYHQRDDITRVNGNRHIKEGHSRQRTVNLWQRYR